VHPCDELALLADPYFDLIDWRRQDTFPQRHHLGVTSQEWIFAREQTQSLVLGPPRSIAGKTASVLIPCLLSTPGPAVVVTTKFDIARATALCRARIGPLHHFGPDGGETPGGFQTLRWSPIQGSQNWDAAQGMARQIVELSDLGQAVQGRASSSDAGHHFGALAGTLLACLFHFAAHHDRTMGWVVDFVAAESPKEMTALKPQMYALSDRAGRQYEGLTWADPRTRGSTYDTANVALRAYQLESGIASASNPNFSLDEFLASSGTIYVTAGSTNQKLTAGIICCFLTTLRNAIYARHDRDQRTGLAVARPPVTFILDELANIAPWPDLGDVLSEGGSQGLQVVGALQDLSQAKARWGDAIGKGWLSAWNNVIVLPGIRDPETLETLSMLCGEWDRPVYGQSWSEGKDVDQAQPSTTLNFDRTRRLRPDEISNGHPQSPDIALALIHGSSPMHMYVTPYHRSPPWTQSIVKSLKHVVAKQPELAVLPVPELTRDGGGLGSKLARMGLWFDWQMSHARYLDLRASTILPSPDHVTTYVWLTETSHDRLYDVLATVFETGETVLWPGDAPICLPGESWRRGCTIVRHQGMDVVYVIDADTMLTGLPPSQLQGITRSLGGPPGLMLCVHYRQDQVTWFRRLRAVLMSHCPTYIGGLDAVGAD
jgi:hypothetical protein